MDGQNVCLVLGVRLRHRLSDLRDVSSTIVSATDTWIACRESLTVRFLSFSVSYSLFGCGWHGTFELPDSAVPSSIPGKKFLLNFLMSLGFIDGTA